MAFQTSLYTTFGEEIFFKITALINWQLHGCTILRDLHSNYYHPSLQKVVKYFENVIGNGIELYQHYWVWGLVWFGLVWFGLVWFGLAGLCLITVCTELGPVAVPACFDSNSFWTQILFGPKFFLDSNLYWIQILFGPKFLEAIASLVVTFSLTQSLSHSLSQSRFCSTGC